MITKSIICNLYNLLLIKERVNGKTPAYTLVLFYLLFCFVKQRTVKEFSDGDFKTVADFLD